MTASGVPTPHQLSDTPLPSRIVLVDPLEIPDWDARISVFPGATIFHSVAWARVLVGTYGFKPVYFVLSNPAPTETRASDSELRAVLPLMEVNSCLTGRRGVGLPFTDDCPPLAVDRDAFAELFEAAAAHGRHRNWASLEVRGGHDWFPSASVACSFYGHQIDLDRDEQASLQRLDPAARRALRKAAQSEVTVTECATINSLKEYYSLHCLTRRRHGQPPQPWSFFEQIHRHILGRDSGRLILAHHQGRPIAGAVFFRFGTKALYKFGASDFALQHLRANDLIFWHAIRAFAREGCTTLDLGRTSLHNKGLRDFKLKWASREHSINYFKYAPSGRNWLRAADREKGIHTYLLRRFPLFLSRFLGRVLYPHVG